MACVSCRGRSSIGKLQPLKNFSRQGTFFHFFPNVSAKATAPAAAFHFFLLHFTEKTFRIFNLNFDFLPNNSTAK